MAEQEKWEPYVSSYIFRQHALTFILNVFVYHNEEKENNWKERRTLSYLTGLRVNRSGVMLSSVDVSCPNACCLSHFVSTVLSDRI